MCQLYYCERNTYCYQPDVIKLALYVFYQVPTESLFAILNSRVVFLVLSAYSTFFI